MTLVRRQAKYKIQPKKEKNNLIRWLFKNVKPGIDLDGGGRSTGRVWLPLTWILLHLFGHCLHPGLRNTINITSTRPSGGCSHDLGGGGVCSHPGVGRVLTAMEGSIVTILNRAVCVCVCVCVCGSCHPGTVRLVPGKWSLAPFLPWYWHTSWGLPKHKRWFWVHVSMSGQHFSLKPQHFRLGERINWTN